MRLRVRGQDSLGRATSSIAIKRFGVFTQPLHADISLARSRRVVSLYERTRRSGRTSLPSKNSIERMEPTSQRRECDPDRLLNGNDVLAGMMQRGVRSSPSYSTCFIADIAAHLADMRKQLLLRLRAMKFQKRIVSPGKFRNVLPREHQMQWKPPLIAAIAVLFDMSMSLAAAAGQPPSST